MKTLIAYSGKHKTTEDCAKKLAGFLEGEITLKDLKKEKTPPLDMYDRIILGGSFYAGQMQSEIKEICEKEKDLMLEKLDGIFVCGMRTEEEMKTQINQAFAPEILERAKVTGHFGGRFDFRVLGFFEKIIVKNIAKVKEDTDTVSVEKIKDFADEINNCNK